MTQSDGVFLFDESNRAFVNGDSPYIGDLAPLRRTLRWAKSNRGMWLACLLGTSIGLMFIYLMGRDLDLDPVIEVVAITYPAVIFVGVVVLKQYYVNRVANSGVVVEATIVTYESKSIRLNGAYRKPTPTTVAHFNFSSPQGQQITGTAIVSINQSTLLDGRPIPPEGTKIALSYVNDRKYFVL